MSKKVLVLMGGFSAEREVSLVTGKGALEALKNKGYEVVEHNLNSVEAFLEAVEVEKPDVVFNALHGNWGEDGEIQGLLDMLQIPYTHSGLRASAIGMDKYITKLICASLGVKVAVSEKMVYKNFVKYGTNLTTPYVLKPVSDGSSIGVFIVKEQKDLLSVCYDDDNVELLVEKYIEGQEITAAVVNGKALTVTELRPKKGFYNYNSKYTDGMTEHIVPADIPLDAQKLAMEYAEKVHHAIGCNGVSRSDFRYNAEDGVVFLEINTNPGLTPLSLVPEQFRFVGGTYQELCQILVEEANCRKM